MKNYIRYFYALLAIPVVILTRYALLPLTGQGTPFITLFPATVIIALLGGMGPAVLTGVLGVLITDFLFIPPLHSWDFGLEFWSRAAVVSLTSIFVGHVGAVLRQARNSLERHVKERTTDLVQTNVRLNEEIEERMRTEQSLRLEEARLDALLHLSQMSEAPLNEMTSSILEQAIALTQSKIGFVGFLNEDQTTYTLSSVSKNVVKECAVEGDPLQWSVAGAGIWADAIRQRKTLFVNDYSQPYPRKHGLPSGHVPLERFMIVPFLEGEKVIAIAGVGNKASDYNASDERQVVLLLNGMWSCMQKNRSREQLQAGRQRFNDVLETLPAYICLLSEDYYMPFANRVFRECFGYYPDKKCYEFLFNRTEPCEDCHTYAVLKTNQPQYWEWTGPNDRDYDVFDFPFKDTDGSPLILEMGIDVTERNRAEEELKRHRDHLEELVEERAAELRGSEARLSRAQEIAHLGSWELDLVRDRLTWSDETYRIFGLRPQEFGATYEAFMERVHPEDRVAVDTAYWDSVRQGKDSYEIEHRVVRADTGEIRYVHEKCEHFRNEAGKAVRSVGMVHDITERKQAEQRLKRSNENLEEFAYVASHDLQEPLRAMSSYSQLLERRYKEKLDQDAKDFIGFIVDAADRMQTLITDLLAYSRAARHGLRVGQVDCNEVVRKVTASLSRALEADDVKISCDELPVLNGAEVSFTQLFQNLIGNAIKFRSAKPPEIVIAARQETHEWVFSVSDNGIGMDPRYAEKIFQVFQRLHSWHEYAGTGIGLSICKKIVENWSGRIWVESVLGKGSTFYFTVPK